MERRALLAAALSVLVIMAWQYFFFPPPPLSGNRPSSVSQTAPKVTDGVASHTGGTQAAPSGEAAMPSSLPTSEPLSATDEETLPREEKVIEGPLYLATFTTEGGGILSWKLKDYSVYQKGRGPLEVIRALFTRENGSAQPPGLMDLFEGISENGTPFHLESRIPEDARFRLVSSSLREVVFERQQQSLLISKRYKLQPDRHVVDLEVTVENRGTAPVTARPGLAVRGRYAGSDGAAYAPKPLPIYYVDQGVEFVEDKDVEATPLQVNGVVGWAGVNDKYFLRAVMPAVPTQGIVTISEQAERMFMTEVIEGPLTIGPGQAQVIHYQMFLGPKRSELLKQYNRDLNKSLDFGMFGAFAEPLLWLLKYLYGFVHSYGLSIILLTIIIKTLFFPLMVKQLESAQKMKEFQPQMAMLREKYQDDKNKLNQEMMRFMQENKINPLGGCLPVLLQMPIWFALYQVLQNSIELYHTPFLYLPDLSEQDPYGVSPLILGVLMFIQQKMTPPVPGMDPMQAKMMQYLPLIFAAIMFTLPSGLVVYILVNTLLTILQQWYITRRAERAAMARSGAAGRR